MGVGEVDVLKSRRGLVGGRFCSLCVGGGLVCGECGYVQKVGVGGVLKGLGSVFTHRIGLCVDLPYVFRRALCRFEDSYAYAWVMGDEEVDWGLVWEWKKHA
ncbi:hypothetical protein PIB30_082256 [Stylosanthes scabra]|uniref:Uncharacterized protein n=1 Tax=Stylosanthes scabra TaxID=79078 RepID=A0ABU6VS47_9FABA|nr:hypothetical protein [Stylosanthes scabra]